MVLEIAIFAIHPNDKAQFESAFTEARKVISAADGFISHELQRCMETDGRYVLLVQWQSVEHHMKGFREAPRFAQWRALLGPYFASPPLVEHYQQVSQGGQPDKGGK